MSHQMRYDVDQQVVWVTFTQKLTADKLLAATVEALKLAQEHGTYRFIYDVCICSMDDSMASIYEIPSRIQKLNPSPYNRIAVLYKQDLAVYEFIENVARNRALNIRKFEDIQDAHDWLAKSKPHFDSDEKSLS